MARDTLVRFGVAMESSLLAELDRVVDERGGTRSELLRDLVRAEVTKAQVSEGANAVAALTLVYDHHVRDLTERLTELQHELGEKVNSSLHVHLNHDYCLEVVVMKGPAHELKRVGDRIRAIRGVKHGGLELIALGAPGHTHSHGGAVHTHGPGEAHDHVHDEPPKSRAGAKKRRARRAEGA